MRSPLFLYKNYNGDLETFVVKVKRVKRKYRGMTMTYESTVATLYEKRSGKSFMVAELDTARDDVWGGVLANILNAMEPFLNSKQYKWDETTKILYDYWHGKEEAEVEKQKQANAKTIWKPAGDFTLWQLAEFLTRIYERKYELLRDRGLFADLDNSEIKGIERGFSRLVLIPIFEKDQIRQIAGGQEPDQEKTHKIIDILVSSKLKHEGPFEDILDPDYRDETPLLSREEELEMDGLWQVCEEQQMELDSIKGLSKLERYLKEDAFWKSPQGKRLNGLNSRRVFGGTLSYDQQEAKKSESAKELNEQIRELLGSWNIGYSALDDASRYYWYLYEKEAKKRWERETEFNKRIDKSKSDLDTARLVLEGRWNSDSLTLIGVVIGIVVSVGFGVASLMSSNRITWALVISALATIVLGVSVKWRKSRLILLKLMSWILK